MANSFNLTSGSVVLIYGAGTFGKDIYKKIKNIYSVKCFIDKNVTTLADLSIEVRNLNHISEYKDNIVLICVHNANWHKEIAETLYQLGFEKILFLAFSDVYHPQKAYIMNQFYNLLMEEEYNSLKNIPTYSAIIQKTSVEKVFRKTSSYVVTYCGKELLYSAKPEHEIAAEKAYYDMPMIADELYISLFRFFMYGDGLPDLYVQTMKCINNSFNMSDVEFEKSQYLIYQLLENEYAKGIEAVSFMPIDVKWNPKGYFNIIDGQHRCAFYILKGMQNMPVRMRKEDYNTWINSMYMKQAETILVNSQVQLAMQINHPILSEYHCKYIEYETTILDIFTKWLYFSKKTFASALELSPYQAYLARNLYRMQKAEEITSIVFDNEEKKLAYALCSLQYIPIDAIKIDTSLSECCLNKNCKYELGMISNIYDVTEIKENIDFINNNITDSIFWQSKSDIEAEKQYIIQHSKFCQYKCLSKMCFDGKLCEIGIFMKEDKIINE